MARRSDVQQCYARRHQARPEKLVPTKGKIASFVAEGDLHDIGASWSPFRANGFDVLDLGRDVAADTVVRRRSRRRAYRYQRPTWMSTTKAGLKKTAETLEEEGLSVPIACGGAAVSRSYVETFGNSIYGRSPLDAVKIATEVCSGKDWKEARKTLH